MPTERRVVQVESLYREVRSVLELARASAYRAVNVAMVRAYWQVGRLIVEHEQSGRRRARATSERSPSPTSPRTEQSRTCRS